MIRIDPVFMGLMKNSATLVRGARPVAPSSTGYGHKNPTTTDGGFFTPDASFYVPRCYFRPYSEQERAMTGRNNESILLFYLYIPVLLVPQELRENISAASTMQVHNVHRLGGALIDPGPFDIEGVEEAAGQNHHWKLALKRIA